MFAPSKWQTKLEYLVERNVHQQTKKLMPQKNLNADEKQYCYLFQW
jgi:hypothetical protein